MVVFTFETENTSYILPARLFKAAVADGLIPKIAPQAIKSLKVLERNWGPGTTKKITFGEGSQFKHVKQVGEVDAENFTYRISNIEGDRV